MRMEATSNQEVEVNSGDTAKKKRSGWSAFYTFLASGGIIVLLVLGVVLAIVISILFK
jgi:hypothetical protein